MKIFCVCLATVARLVFLFTLHATTAQAASTFHDPLDTPAKDRTGLSERPLIAITSAGHRLVAVGPRGLIIVSGDDGKTWEQSEVPVQSDLVAVDFATPKVGWAVGHSGVVLRTVDGGRTWVKQIDGRAEANRFTRYYQKRVKSGDKKIAAGLALTKLNFSHGPGLPYLAVWFRSVSKGIVVGAFGKIAATTDGGRTWKPWLDRINNSKQGLSLYDIRSINGNVYIAGERGAVFKFSSGNKHFQRVGTGYSGAFFGVTGNNKVLLAYGVSGAMYRSKDQGNTWKKIKVPVSASINAGIRRRDGKGFVFATQDGELLLCNGAGRRFRVVGAKKLTALTGVLSLKDGSVVITGLGGVERQTLPAAAS